MSAVSHALQFGVKREAAHSVTGFVSLPTDEGGAGFAAAAVVYAELEIDGGQ